jgi:NitT/TauT family transport system ATP-binding protein
MESELIEVRDLRVTYDDTEVLHGLNVTISQGEFVTIAGKSGCGKSTFLLALAGFIRSSGSIKIPSEIGMVFQNYAVFPWLTVRDNIAFGLRNLPPQEREPIVNRYLDMVELTDHAGKYPAQLSGGQTQRVALARAFAPNPKVIFMDEPFGALDTFTRNNMQDWLGQAWKRENKTILFVTHSIEEALFLSDRILLFGDGQICGDLEIDFAHPRTPEMKFDPRFVELCKKILAILSPETSPAPNGGL